MIADRDGRKRVVIDTVRPQVDEGRFAIKRSLGETVGVRADVFADGHDRIRVELLYRGPDQESWTVQPMTHRVNDEWVAGFAVTQLGDYLYTVRGWVDPFATWQANLARRAETNQDVAVELRSGIEMLRALAKRADRSDAEAIRNQVRRLRSARQVNTAVRIALSDELTALAARYPDRSLANVTTRNWPLSWTGRMRCSARGRTVAPFVRSRRPTRDLLRLRAAPAGDRADGVRLLSCRRSIRSDGRIAKAATTPPPARQRTPAARGPSAAPKEATPPLPANWAR
jgi:hypothetical protein